MAGCMPCFIIPLLLFIFHKFIQPYLLKIWNPWGDKAVQNTKDCKLDCGCFWNKNKNEEVAGGDQKTEGEKATEQQNKEVASGQKVL